MTATATAVDWRVVHDNVDSVSVEAVEDVEQTNQKKATRVLSELDRDVIEFTSVLADLRIKYVVVSGYVAILTGRSRSTEVIDVVLESLSGSELDQLATRLKTEGFWGMAMPLDALSEMLGGGDRLRIAEDGEMYPNIVC